MTCRERLAMETPEAVSPSFKGGCAGCPYDYDYLDKPDFCDGNEDDCRKCWDREIPGTGDNSPRILDSGHRREFETGAVRDIQEGKGRCDLLPLDVIALAYYEKSPHAGRGHVFDAISKYMLAGNFLALYDAIEQFMLDDAPFGDCNWSTMFLEVAKHFEEGCKKYGENNWQKGIPTHCYIDSAVRHYLKWARGDKDEPHDRAFCWNILCCIWTCINKPELNDYAKENEHEEPVS